MGKVIQIIGDYGGPGRGGKLSIFNFDGEGFPVNDIGVALNSTFRALAGAFVNSWYFRPRTEYRVYDEFTGELQEINTAIFAQNVAGSGGTDSVPDASQILVRHNTGIVLDGRRVRGRTFIPGANRAQIVGGNFGGASVFDTEFARLAAVGHGVWRKPVRNAAGQITRPGLLVPVNGYSTWSEWAVQRRRRG